MTTETPAQIDTQLAELYAQDQKITTRIQATNQSLLSYAGATFYYRGRQRVTDMTPSQARPIVEAELARIAASDNPRQPLGTTRSFTLPHAAQDTLDRLDALYAEREQVQDAYNELEARYTGWSRFFLVTSSTGHIHSSMCCSTCRPTTTYGWLPELSGQSEADAVEAHGPALCSVCFPSAPVEWTGQKLTKAQAAKAAA